MSALARRVRALRAQRRDGGIVAILTALLMLVFLGFCGVAVDIGHWYLVRQQTQKAAEAAASAAVTKMPFDLTGAQAVAEAYSTMNGYENGVDGTTVVAAQDLADPNRITVTVKATVHNFFTGLFDLSTTDVSGSGSASFIGPTQLAGQCNRLGSDPENQFSKTPSCDNSAGRMWMNINAPGTDKLNGDATASAICAGPEDGCGGSTTNGEYSPKGYFYDITVRQPTTLKVELFDPVWVNVGLGSNGDQCHSAVLLALSATSLFLNPRYAWGGDSDFCTGDSKLSGHTSAAHMDTTFTLRSADGDPQDPGSHARIANCQTKYVGYNPVDLGDFLTELFSGGLSPSGQLWESFRQWTTLCTVSVTTPGTYVLQVQSAGDLGAGNRYSVRATGTSQSDTKAITVAAHGAVSLFANDTTPPSRYYLAKVPSSAHGRTLKLRLFDIGDCGLFNLGQCTVRILAPGPAHREARNCQGLSQLTPGGCSFVASAAVFNGKWAEVDVPIPADYSCTPTSPDPTECWYQFEYADGRPRDVSTWTASIDGPPTSTTP